MSGSERASRDSSASCEDLRGVSPAFSALILIIIMRNRRRYSHSRIAKVAAFGLSLTLPQSFAILGNLRSSLFQRCRSMIHITWIVFMRITNWRAPLLLHSDSWVPLIACSKARTHLHIGVYWSNCILIHSSNARAIFELAFITGKSSYLALNERTFQKDMKRINYTKLRNLLCIFMHLSSSVSDITSTYLLLRFARRMIALNSDAIELKNECRLGVSSSRQLTLEFTNGACFKL